MNVDAEEGRGSETHREIDFLALYWHAPRSARATAVESTMPGSCPTKPSTSAGHPTAWERFGAARLQRRACATVPTARGPRAPLADKPEASFNHSIQVANEQPRS